MRNKRRNFILITHHYPDLSSTSDWLKQISHMAWPIGSTTQIWLVMRHQYVIFCTCFSDFIFTRKPLVALHNVRCFLRRDFSKLCLLTISCRLNPGLIMLMNRGLQARESLLSTKDPHFQNKAQCKTFHARMSLFEWELKTIFRSKILLLALL